MWVSLCGALFPLPDFPGVDACLRVGRDVVDTQLGDVTGMALEGQAARRRSRLLLACGMMEV